VCGLGSWEPLAEGLFTWRQFDPDCRLANHIQKLAPAACAISGCKIPGEFEKLRRAWNATKAPGAVDRSVVRARPPVKIFVGGDSVDRYFGLDLCSLFEFPVIAFAAKGIYPCDALHVKKGPQYHTCITCKLPGVIYTKEAIWSLHMSGPLEHNLSGFADERVKQGLVQFKEEFGEPDLVVISSNLWDVGRWHNLEWGGRTDDLPGLLPFSYLESWIANMTRVVQVAKASVPMGATIAIRTPVPPDSYLQEEGRLLYANLGYQAHYAQLAEASRFVAAKEGVQVVDLYSMYSSMNNHTMYLRDGGHGAVSVGMEVVNIYLDIVEKQRMKSRRPRSD